MSADKTARVLGLRFALITVVAGGVAVVVLDAADVSWNAAGVIAGDAVAVLSILIGLLVLGLAIVGTAPKVRSLQDSADAGVVALVLGLHMIAIHVALASVGCLLLAQVFAAREPDPASASHVFLALGLAGLLHCALSTLWLVRNTSRLLLT